MERNFHDEITPEVARGGDLALSSEPLMKITWLLPGIFVRSGELDSLRSHPPSPQKFSTLGA